MADWNCHPPDMPLTSKTEVSATGSNDSDAFGHEGSTGRMTQYNFTVNNSSVVGNLTWNANGTLNTLAITDPFNSSNQQACSYGYDDIARISSAHCVNGANTVWGQTFNFTSAGAVTGAHGNLSKVGTGGAGIGFSPTYDLSSNRITSVGTQSYSYDYNGNLTSTGTGTGTASYNWDADGHMIADSQSGQTSVNLTYDALGRMVEQGRGSSTTQIVYAPTGGKLALMNGQTLAKAFVPLPAGGTAVYTSSGLAYYRHSDWLGSSRFASTPARAMYYDGAYAPYGENYAEAGTPDRSFTGLNQDTTSNLYDAMFREHDYTQGRWISPDPAGLAAVDLTNPQSLNRYAYVVNNPTGFVDPLGLRCIQEGADPKGDPIWGDDGKSPTCTYGGTTTITVNGGTPPTLTLVSENPVCVAEGADGCLSPPCEVLNNPTGCFNAPPFNAHPQGNSGGGSWNSQTPPPGVGKPGSECSEGSIFANSFDVKTNIGLEVKSPVLKFGFSLFKNNMTGETGSELGASIYGIGASASRTVPTGGAINSGGPANISATVGPFSYQPSTGATSWQWGKFLGSWGGTLGVGFSVEFNSQRYAAQTAACRGWTDPGGG
ncbi:MAG TPA: RHS repeat-associated core domain-containing protein [Terriglobia bacterium]|nr:RHS repeat-associated core domain-containing protein [Terriglobia bacterium]